MFLHPCDRSRPKSDIRDWLIAIAADAGEQLSRAKADKLADKFKRGAYDPILASILTYQDPTGDRAVRGILAHT